MKLDSIRPVIWVTDVKATLDYYVNVLGFSQTAYDAAVGWGEVVKDNVVIMFSAPNEHIPYDKLQFTGSFYLNTNNVDECWQQLKDKASILYPIENFDYGMREFAITDCNGYILQFGQTLNEPVSANEVD